MILSLIKEITTEPLYERSGLKGGPSVPVGTILLDGQASPTTSAAHMSSSFSLIQIQLFWINQLIFNRDLNEDLQNSLWVHFESKKYIRAICHFYFYLFISITKCIL